MSVGPGGNWGRTEGLPGEAVSLEEGQQSQKLGGPTLPGWAHHRPALIQPKQRSPPEVSLPGHRPA